MCDEQEKEDAIGEGSFFCGKKYKVVKKLGEGGCGSVYEVEDTENPGVSHALKIEYNSAINGSILKQEVSILQQLESKKHVMKLIASGKKQDYCFMVMSLLGQSLCALVTRYGPILNVSTQVRIGICLLYGVKQIHDIGYVHRDLKPANCALGNKGSSEERILLILDFGMARQFITDVGQGQVALRKPRERIYFRGTSRYCSIGMHDRSDQGRVDDLWAILYILAELRCKLPWADVCEKTEIAEMKKNCSDELLLSKSPVQLIDFASYIRTLTYYDHPDYAKIFKIFDNIMKNGEYKWSDPYHWERNDSKKNKKSMESERPIRKPLKLLNQSISLVSSRSRKTKRKAKKDDDKDYFVLDDFTSNALGF